jgi:hypothetical protein
LRVYRKEQVCGAVTLFSPFAVSVITESAGFARAKLILLKSRRNAISLRRKPFLQRSQSDINFEALP